MVVRQPSKLVTWVRFPSPAPTHLYDRNCRLPGVVDGVMRSVSPDMEAALRRLLVGLERPVHLDEGRQGGPLAEAVAVSVEERGDLPKAPQTSRPARVLLILLRPRPYNKPDDPPQGSPPHEPTRQP